MILEESNYDLYSEVDPKTGENIYCLVGRYGAYLQLGEKTEENQRD